MDKGGVLLGFLALVWLGPPGRWRCHSLRCVHMRGEVRLWETKRVNSVLDIMNF